MRHKSKLTLILFTIIIFSFPSICFSELKTVQGNMCKIYSGDFNNKEEFEKFTDSLRMESIENGLDKMKNGIVRPKGLTMTKTSIRDIIENYMKVVVISHTKVGRRLCEKVKITLDTKIINEYLKELDREQKPKREIEKSQDKITRTRELELWVNEMNCGEWCLDFHSFLRDYPVQDKKDITVGILIETKIPNLGEHDKDYNENKEEKQFHEMIEMKNITDKSYEKTTFRIVDRRHLTKILEEQKLSSSGITDSETIKLGKILNLDIIVLRILYDKSQVTKVLKVETGEVLLFKTYETKTEEGWIYYGETDWGKEYYDKKSMTNVSQNVVRVWVKKEMSRILKDKFIQLRKKHNKPIDGWDKLDYEMILEEADCKDNTIKIMETVKYNTKGEVLDRFVNPNPEADRILPGSIGESLRRKVCPK